MAFEHFQCLKKKSNEIFLISWYTPFFFKILGLGAGKKVKDLFQENDY